MIKVFFFSIFTFWSALVLGSQDYRVQKVYELNVQSTINPAILRYLKSGFEQARSTENSLVLIKLNTPGGLVSTTKDIIGLIGESHRPVVIWVTPEGASATSAGALISSSAHFLFMSPGSNIGAATPIGMGGDIGEKIVQKNNKGEEKVVGQSDVRAKAVNDLVALTKSLCEARGRSAKHFELMISQAKSYSGIEALEKGIINGVINNRTELTEAINNKNIKILGKEYITLMDATAEFQPIEMSAGDYLLNIFSNPQLAYILFLIGAALIYFELQAPGGFISGSLGVIFLILAGMGFQVLPVNVGAIGLIILSFILFVIEMYVTSYGILTLGGVVSLVFGSSLLFETSDSLIILDKRFIFSAVGGIVAFVALITYIFIHYRRKDDQDFFGPLKEEGVIHKVNDEHGKKIYQVKIGGSFWKAQSHEDNLEVGDRVRVSQKDQSHLLIWIQKI
ncbi:MAG: nodulation protein NfeD [Halobacteriovoraceae bacterium]|nr:nodulation protein NfeD [Halobacteriovoraceae bacterium]